jgi:modulator of FtsH protease
MEQDIYTHQNASTQQLDTSKVLKSTYALLAMTLLFSALTAGISMAVGMPHSLSLVFSIGALLLVWFVLPRTANSGMGIVVVFAFTGLLGASLGPILNHYLAMANGGMVITQALGGTALVFFSLSAYVLTTRKDFSFMGGFLMIGIVVVIVGMVGMLVASMFGIDVSLLHVGFSMLIVLLMSGFILYDTSRIVNGGETNYIMATTSLYLNIYNLFISLLHLLGFMSND